MFSLFASLALTVVQAAPAAAPAQAPAATESEAKEKKICRKIDTSSSRMAKRTCKTEAEWAKHDSSGANAADLKRLGAR